MKLQSFREKGKGDGNLGTPLCSPLLWQSGLWDCDRKTQERKEKEIAEMERDGPSVNMTRKLKGALPCPIGLVGKNHKREKSLGIPGISMNTDWEQNRGRGNHRPRWFRAAVAYSEGQCVSKCTVRVPWQFSGVFKQRPWGWSGGRRKVRTE